MFVEDVALFDYHFYQSRYNLEGSCAPEITYIYFYVFISFYLKVGDLLGFYCRPSTVYNIMFLDLILILYFSCPLSEENAVGVRFQSHTEYKKCSNFAKM